MQKGMGRDARTKTEAHILCIKYQKSQLLLLLYLASAFQSTTQCPTHRESNHVNLQFASLPLSSLKHMHTLRQVKGRSIVRGKGRRWFARGQKGMLYFKTILKGGGAH